MEIPRAIDFVTHIRRVWSKHDSPTASLHTPREPETLRATLLKISEFDFETWIETVAMATAQKFPILARLCEVWKSSAGVYTSRVLY